MELKMSSYLPLIPPNKSDDTGELALALASRLQLESSIMCRVHDLTESSCEKTLKEAVEALELLSAAAK